MDFEDTRSWEGRAAEAPRGSAALGPLVSAVGLPAASPCSAWLIMQHFKVVRFALPKGIMRLPKGVEIAIFRPAILSD